MKKLTLLVLLILAVKVNAENVSIIANGYKLNGTLEIPVSDKPVDVALIIAGSGPTDRDGNNKFNLNGDSYKMISELLMKNGIACLRYDKRGIGANDLVNEFTLNFEMYVDDAVECINFLKKDKRFANVVVIGHSEGSLIGMIAAKRANADKFISLCGPGKSIDKVLDEQILGQYMPGVLKDFYKSAIDSLRQGLLVKNVEEPFNLLFNPSSQPYLISWMKYDPCSEIAKLDIPILLVGGTTDIQVNTKHAELLAKANPKSKVVIIENMNHVLKEFDSDDRMGNAESYKYKTPLHDELGKCMVEFITHR